MQDFTDSYCERCGTRYTFGPPAPKGPSMATARVLARGLKHFVMNDSSTIDDAIAAARIDEERTNAAQITEEFHRVFSFCMTCRQYACEKCWNPNQSACLSCAPLWDTEPVAPEGHLIIRTPATHLTAASQVPEVPDTAAPDTNLDELLRRRSADLAAADPVRRTAGETRRETRRDQKATEQLRARSESWKTQDDGWSLWPSDQPAPASSPTDMTLTPDELLLVQSELDTPPYQEPDEPQPKRKPSGRRAQSQPEAAPPPSDFGLVGSLRETPASVPQHETTPPATDTRRGPVLGRLLGEQKPVADAPRPVAGPAARPTPPKPARAAKKGKGRGASAEASGEAWPHATPWSQRPVARHDWWADSDAVAARGAEAADEPELIGAAFGAERAAPVQWDEPIPWQEPAPPPSLEPSPPAQAGREFEQSPAAWLAAAKRTPEQRPEHAAPEHVAPVREPAPLPPQAPSEPPAPGAPWAPSPAPASERAQAWPPMGAHWPARPAPEPASWLPPDADVAASSAARSQLDQVAAEEAVSVSEMWAESAQRVMDRGSARVCYRCSLPLSTHARFCRRCGTSQQG